MNKNSRNYKSTMAPSIAFCLIAICSMCLVKESFSQSVQSTAPEDVSELAKVAVFRVESVPLTDGSMRKHRSPYYDDDDDESNDYGDYSYGSDAHHLSHGHKKKKHYKQPLLLGLLGGHGGRRGHGCGGDQGWRPQTVGHNHGSHGGQGGSFASASAGSVGGSHGGGHSQANAQSANFNVGPYSASFSVAQASSSNRGDGIRE